MTARTPATTSHRRSPALDGLRGFALFGMLLWHAQVDVVRGGFARMTVFFVLAGFLAAGSFERQRARDPDKPFRSFWKRRARRLLPITIIGVLWALAVTSWIGSSQARSSAGGDTLSVLFSWSNWRFIIDERPYGALFEAPSAFQHYWSLSLEEQCFLLLPVLLGLAALVSRSRHADRMAMVLAGLAVAFGLLPFVIEMTSDTAYYGTHVRIGEFLAGAALAVWLRERDLRSLAPRTRYRLNALGLLSLLVLVLVMLTISREQEWLYRGGMIIFALPTVAIIAAVMADAPGVSRLLSIVPLRALGRWALSIYVIHWPLFQLLEHAFPTWPRAVLATVEVASAVVTGMFLFALAEQPLMLANRRRRVPRASGARELAPVPAAGPSLGATMGTVWRRDRAAFAILGCLAVLALVVGVAMPRTPEEIDFAAAEQIAAGNQGNTRPTEVRDAKQAGVGVFGGSTALMVGLGENAWAAGHPGVQNVRGHTGIGCGLLTDGQRRVALNNRGPGEPAGKITRAPTDCLDWHDDWPKAVRDNDVDVAVLVASQWDRGDWEFDGRPGLVHVGDAAFDDILEVALREAVDTLHDAGAREVVLLTSPSIAGNQQGRIDPQQAERAAAYNHVLERAAATRPFLSVVDFGRWVDALPPDRMKALFPDGIHPTADTAKVLWTEFLGPRLDDVVDSMAADGATKPA